MTLSALGVVAVYAGSGSTGPFALQDDAANPILFENNSEIIVSKFTNPDDTHPTLLVITTDYTLTGAGLDTPGSVTLIAPLAAGTTLLIARVTAATQGLNLTFGGDLSLENLEEELDKHIRLIQELKEQADRSLQFAATHPALGGSQTRIVPAPVAGQLLAWNSAADRLINASGHLFYSGSGAPSASLGGDGDFYIDYTNNLLYGPKVGLLWGSGVSIVGPPGATGPTGPQGPAGPLGSGNGDVTGPASSTDNAVARFDLTTGKLLQNSVVLIGDTGAITGALSIDLPNAGLLLRDTNASHTLQISPGSNLTANRIFTLTTGDAARTLDISAASVTVSAFAATVLDDADAATTRTTLGAGDVVGPASSVASRIAIFSGTTGKLLADGGVLTTTVGAGKHSVWVPAAAMFASVASAGSISLNGAGSLRYLAFDASSVEVADFSVAMPKSWDEGTLTAKVYWAHPATTVNFGVVWGVQAGAFGDDDTLNVDVYTGADIADTGGTTSDLYISTETGAIDPGNTQAEGDLLVFRILRQTANGSDTMAVDAFLVGVMLFYTTNANTDA